MIGKCLCEEIEFEINGTLPNFYQCHCSLCRKLSGSASDTATFLDKTQFQWLKGKESIFSFETSTGYRSDFCRVCGSTVPHLMNNKRQYWVPAGLLEGELDSIVTSHIFVGSKAHWDIIGDDGVQHTEMPDIETLNKALQRVSR
ncbi:GFA family protein [Thalassotalea sp. ND16A]|uniref:GFA family protein n=1 Tax=Thalassotalea sp. ND16A TaxID=1535422 RepID=UPI00051A5D53|nr:GFA family protein [Thalassotalea sp. ND16A]KGJ89424.1 hypothetical protein ND16A_2317 [Thalassotalea sp. ND16A]